MSGATSSRSQGKLWRNLGRLAGVVVLLAILVPFLGMSVFNRFVYPDFGIEQFQDDEYHAAMLQAADLYGRSLGYEAVEVVESEFRDLAPQGGKFCWGIVTLVGTGENAGIEQRCWVSLKKYAGPWMRSDTNIFPDTSSVSLLVDPQNELFFNPLTIPNFVKLRMEAQRLWREQKRRLWEVYGMPHDGDEAALRPSSENTRSAADERNLLRDAHVDSSASTDILSCERRDLRG